MPDPEAYAVEQEVLLEAAGLVREVTGLVSPEDHHSHLRRILLKMSRARKEKPRQLLGRIARDKELLQEFLNQALIGETYFFREVAQYKIILETIIPGLLARKGSLKIWSASTSTGEEALSLAALVWHLTSGQPERSRAKVYASDINTRSLARIKRGLYPRSAFRNDGRDLHPHLEKHITGGEGEFVRIAPELLGLISVHPLNLFRDELAGIPDNLDIIFFRNTLIYAPEDNRCYLADRVVRKLRPGGFLFVATSEVPFVSHPQLESVAAGRVYYFSRLPADTVTSGKAQSSDHDDPCREQNRQARQVSGTSGGSYES